MKLFNDFHNTSCKVRPDSQGFISEKALKRADKKLCGIDDCCCGGIWRNQNFSRYNDGTYLIKDYEMHKHKREGQ